MKSLTALDNRTEAPHDTSVSIRNVALFTTLSGGLAAAIPLASVGGMLSLGASVCTALLVTGVYRLAPHRPLAGSRPPVMTGLLLVAIAAMVLQTFWLATASGIALSALASALR